ncbi:MAG: hypothetical protein ACFFA3_13590 [Promethearchaeota archaeon]
MNGEIIFLRLLDAGRSIDLSEPALLFPRLPIEQIIKTKDTPSYVIFPKPMIIEVKGDISYKSDYVKELRILAKIYEDGIISLLARMRFTDTPLEELHNFKKVTFFTSDGEFNIKNLLEFHSNKIFNQIRPYINEENYDLNHHEEYTIFCLTDEIENPRDLIDNNKKYFASLLMGENPLLNLHDNQINNTLNHTFSFLKNDLVVFDFERCLIIDPNCDYEDILLITEIANYQLLELRSLDYLVDKRISLVESDIHTIYFKSRAIFKRLNKRVGRLLRLRHDLTFLLENIENISKLIGDYYLSQIYTYLANLFELKHWSDSIRHRIDTLGDIYNISHTNINEKILLYVEILLSFIFIMEFVFLILDFFK